MDIVEVSVDGAVKATVDCYSQAAAYDVLFYQISGLANVQHTISLRVTGQKNATSAGTLALIDAFSYLPSDNSAVFRSCQGQSTSRGNQILFQVLGRHFMLPSEFQGKDISIDIADLHGRVVRRIKYPSGKVLLGRNSESVEPGIYFVKFTAG